MEKAKEWLQNPKNAPIVIAGTVVIILLVVLRMMMVSGMIGGGSDTAQFAPPPSTQPGGSSTAPGAVPSTATAPTSSAPAATAPAPSAPATPAPGTGSTAAPATVASSSVATPTGGIMGPMLPYRKDPFSPLGGAPSVRNVLVQLLPTVQLPSFPRSGRIKRVVYDKDYKNPIPTIEEPLPAQPLRRMAGVLMSGRLSAIMETNGESDIVKPGMTISKGGSTVLVESIEPSAIILKTLDTRTPHRIRVNLTGAIEAAPTAPSPDSTGTGSDPSSRRRRTSTPPGSVNP